MKTRAEAEAELIKGGDEKQPPFVDLADSLRYVGETIARQMGVKLDPDELDLVQRASEALLSQAEATDAVARNKQRIERGKLLNLALAYLMLISFIPLLMLAIRLGQLVLAWTP
jgi:predicted kinase